MKRIMCAAVVALTLMLASNPEAKANGGGDWTFRPGMVSLNGSIGLQWAGGGIKHFNDGPYYGHGGGYGGPGYGGPGYGGPGFGGPGYGFGGPGYGYGAPAYGYGYGYGR